MEIGKSQIHPVYSLGAWLKQCAALGIDSIPAEKIGACWPMEIMAAAWGDRDVPCANLRDLFAAVKAKGPADKKSMYRWDCCAPMTLKGDIASQGYRGEHAMQLSCDDPRLFSILEEDWPFWMPVALWRRPWIEAARHDGWPVEFRVFIDDRKVIGVSNYYPQISLSEEYRDQANKAVALTGKLLPHCEAGTCDWLLTPEKRLVFIEGGPPHTPTGGAHPCCFAIGKIEGVALSPQEGSEPPEVGGGTESTEKPPHKR